MGFSSLRSFPWPLTLLGLLGLSLSGCQLWSQVEAQTQPRSRPEQGPTAVDVARATPGQLRADIEYTGTTRPLREVSLKAQVEGQLRELTVDVGDAVQAGQVLARLDDTLLRGSVNQAQAEKAAQRSAVASAQSQVGDAQIKVDQARLQLQQAQADILRLETTLKTRIEQARLEAEQTRIDAERFSTLAQEGAATAQIAEQSRTKAKQAEQILRNEKVSAEQQLSQARTTAQTAAKVLRSAEAQVKVAQQQVTAAEAQVKAQKALISQSQTRQAYATLRSPIAGKVLQRSSEAGNLVQPGTEILRLGDFSQVKVALEISELQLAKVRLGQAVDVKLDAFPNRTWPGTVSRISPAADPQSRLIPIELTLANPDGKIGSGLLARVSFPQSDPTRVVIPQEALQGQNQVFILQGQNERTTVQARTVKPGASANGKVEILTGLAPGERYVLRSSRPLRPGQAVRLSALSDSSSQL
ncbi:efflux RND transporter periplasmic adaptor subunit [Synechocystis sp. LKSZ1]|uniref:efflux RND transporter periplasmic adaptor subunit n=1 Tax=Synechocystis sp. LKSZ1 TaxID=3144951 RepID=UPI00336C277B